MKDEIEINGVKYERIISKQEIESFPYVIVRTYSAGVFAGSLEKRIGQEVVLRNARR